MTRKKSLIGLLIIVLVVYLSSQVQSQKPKKGRIVHRPGKKPLRCYNVKGVSKCVELKDDEIAELKKEDTEDPHDMELGPMGGKLYRMGTYGLECFKNGQCFRVEEEDLPTTPAPVEEEEPERGVFYRVGNGIVECFPDGTCKEASLEDVGDEVIHGDSEGGVEEADKDYGAAEEENTGDAAAGVEENTEDAAAGEAENTDDAVAGEEENTDNAVAGEKENTDDLPTTPTPVEEEEPARGVFYRVGNGIVECFPDGTCKEASLEDVGDEVIHGDSEHGGEEENTNDAAGGEEENTEDTAGGEEENKDYGNDLGNSGDSETNDVGGDGRAICEFKNMPKTTGSIVLIEGPPMKVIGKLHGLNEGIHVLTFHDSGDVETPECRGVGVYKTPEHPYHGGKTILDNMGRRRKKRQMDMFRLGQAYMMEAYTKCMRHVETCKKKKFPSHICETHLNRCIPILKCKKCKEVAGDSVFTTFDTVADLEETGHFTFSTKLPRNSLTIYADDEGDANFSDEEREQRLTGSASVIGGSIVVSEIPPKQDGEFIVISCCKIEKGGPTIVL